VTVAKAPLPPVDAIVIGTSAGGVEALSVLLPALSRGYHGAVLVVLHLPREHPSLLVDIFGPKCALAVREAADKEPVAPGTIYFAPSDYHLLVDHGPELALSMDAPVNFSRPSIDVLFESAADAYGARAVGVLLTGVNQDGAEGLARIAAAGGFTIAQDPETAERPEMPGAAVRRGAARKVLDLERIGPFLAGLDAAKAGGGAR
jgi:two-component system, chemotaxis family, protein-glutamate methylesterase/glutaminase